MMQGQPCERIARALPGFLPCPDEIASRSRLQQLYHICRECQGSRAEKLVIPTPDPEAGCWRCGGYIWERDEWRRKDG